MELFDNPQQFVQHQQATIKGSSVSDFQRRYLFLTVFIAGMCTLAIEFTTSRMLQSVYGTSNIVWANVIGLVLLSLTLGYFIGGRLATGGRIQPCFI